MVLSASLVEIIKSPVSQSVWLPYPTLYEINTWVGDQVLTNLSEVRARSRLHRDVVLISPSEAEEKTKFQDLHALYSAHWFKLLFLTVSVPNQNDIIEVME